MTRGARAATVMAVLVGLALVPADAEGQRRNRGDRMRADPHVTLEVLAGLANYGRFLEQAVFTNFGAFAGQRELTAENTLALGASIGFWPRSKTGVRLGFTWAESNLEFEDDSGTDADDLDLDEQGDIRNYTGSIELMRFLLDEKRRVAPYATAGLSATWWNLEEEEAGGEVEPGNDDSQFRFGGVAGVGLQIRATPQLGLRLEANTFALGNPFDGDDAYVAPTGFTIDEPSQVRFSRFSAGLTYTFLRR